MHKKQRFNYEDAFFLASQGTLERLARIEAERNVAQDHLSELIALNLPARERAVRSEPRFHSYSLAAKALVCSEQEVPRDLTKAWELARLGHSVVSRVDPRACGGAEALIDLKACAFAIEGNALRVRGDFRAAFRAFSYARLAQRGGGVDPELAATIDLCESSLRRDLWQLNAALRLLDRATDVFVSLRERDRMAQTLLGRANIYIVKNDWAQAAAILQSALSWPLDFRFSLAVRHNLADVLVKAGQAQNAAQVFSTTRDYYDRCKDVQTTARRLWLEGLISRGLGDLQQATELLEMAVESFRANGYAGDAALADLDLIVTRKTLARSRRRKASIGR